MENPYRENIKPFSTQWLQIEHIPDRAGCRVLELGCNTGYVGARFHSTGFWGVEYDSVSAAEAEKVYESVTIADLNRVDLDTFDPGFELNSFDVLLAGDILEHLLRPEDVLVFFLKYIKYNGRIVISLPNIANIRIRLSLLLGNFNYTTTGILDRTHLHFYTKKTAKKDFSKYITIEKTLFGSTTFGRICHHFSPLGPILGNTIILYKSEKKGRGVDGQ